MSGGDNGADGGKERGQQHRRGQAQVAQLAKGDAGGLGRGFVHRKVATLGKAVSNSCSVTHDTEWFRARRI